VVPVRSIHARPSPKFFGRKRGITWLNMLNDQSAGLAAKVPSGTPRDSLNVIDVVRLQRGGKVPEAIIPEAIITDTGSYSDIVFGLLHLIGIKYRPQLANLPDQRLWRFDGNADYGPLSQAARGRIDPAGIAAHWDGPGSEREILVEYRRPAVMCVQRTGADRCHYGSYGFARAWRGGGWSRWRRRCSPRSSWASCARFPTSAGTT
jgi:Tn3 transposase DDE domain